MHQKKGTKMHQKKREQDAPTTEIINEEQAPIRK
jgi:hypothetical protein